MDDELRDELNSLVSQMSETYNLDTLREPYDFMGDESLSMEEAMNLMEKLHDMHELDRQLREVARGRRMDVLDKRKFEALLGEEAKIDLDQLQQLVEMLELAGYLRLRSGKLELTPKGTRKLADRALTDIFAQLKKDKIGPHHVQRHGVLGDQADGTKPYEFGDPFDLDLKRTVYNAMLREGANVPVKLVAQDFEVTRHDDLSQAATVMLIDQSRSMGLMGSFLAAKKVALALYALIKGQFPRDRFYVVGFSEYAVEILGPDLPEVSWNAWVSGTNMHHALMLARNLLSKAKCSNSQIIMITDGEPTAHIEQGYAYFDYPPSYRTILETLKEVKRCTRQGITINTFMLETNSYLLDFVDRMSRINKGRTFYTTPDRLGEYILVDYLSNRRKWIS